jgi:hypothetical protein
MGPTEKSKAISASLRTDQEKERWKLKEMKNNKENFKKWKKGEGNGCRPGQILRCRVNETLHEYPITSIYNLSITWKGILQS